MILRGIEIRGWRCFAGAVKVGPLGDGLNIIHGPNGIGKSTLMSAVARGLFDSHSVRGADMLALRPWGRDLSPKVTIEFEHEGDRFRLTKQFLQSAASVLDRMEAGRFVPLAENREADDRARGLLAGDAPGRGATDARHWGLAQILWATQGSLQIEQLAGSTRATIEDALGAQIAAPGSDAIEKRIVERYDKIYTATGRLRSGTTAPAIVEKQARLEAATKERDTLRRRLEEFEDASRRIEDFGQAAEAARREEHELNDRIKTLRGQAQSYRELTHRRALHRQAADAAEEDYRRQSDKIEAIRDTEKELQTVSQSLAERQAELPAQTSLVEQCERDVEAAERRKGQVAGRRGEVAEARGIAETADRYARTLTLQEELEKRISRIEAAEEELARLRKTREQIAVPDRPTMTKIGKLARERDDSRLRLDAAVITVTVTPEEERPLSVTRGEAPGSETLAAAKPTRIRGVPEVAFVIPGVGEFRATGPTGDFEQLQRQWESADSRFRELTAGFGTDDVAVLETRRGEVDELERQIDQAKVKVETLLDGSSLESYRERRRQAAGVLREILETFPSWQDSSPDPAESRRRGDELAEAFERDVRDADGELDRVRRAHQAAVQKRSAAATEIARLEAEAGAIRRRLESLRADGPDDNRRREKLTDAALRRDTELGKLKQVESEIDTFDDDPVQTLEIMERQLEAVRDRSVEAGRKLDNESGRLEQITSEAPYTAVAQIEEEIEALREQIARQQVEIDAIRLLRETLESQRRDVMRSVLHPIRTRANHILRRIAGSRFEDVRFDESLLPSGVSPRHAEDAVSLAEISGGEREQVHFAVRMALADAAFRDSRQLVILDDVFTYTDATRLARIAAILGDFSERFQIVLLTCHPERYRGLAGAEFFDLESISVGEDGTGAK